MASYGRNVDFRVPPIGEHRKGRYAVPATGTAIPIGAPVSVNDAAAKTALGLQPVQLVTAAGPPPKGRAGILVYEHAPSAFAGSDPFLTVHSDMGTVPLGAAVQVVSGTEVKVVFKNTVDRTFLGSRDYTGRVMIAGLGATPTLAVGDFVGPGPGNDTGGYWQESSEANAWLVITDIDTGRSQVECRVLF